MIILCSWLHTVWRCMLILEFSLLNALIKQFPRSECLYRSSMEVPLKLKQQTKAFVTIILRHLVKSPLYSYQQRRVFEKRYFYTWLSIYLINSYEAKIFEEKLRSCFWDISIRLIEMKYAEFIGCVIAWRSRMNVFTQIIEVKYYERHFKMMFI